METADTQTEVVDTEKHTRTKQRESARRIAQKKIKRRAEVYR